MDSAAAKPRWWQFSLRELLLITLVAALVFSHVARTVYERNPGLSPFYEQFDPGAWSNSPALGQSFPAKSVVGGGQSLQQSYGAQRYLLTLASASGVPTREQVVAEFARLADQGLSQAQCQVLSTMKVGDPVTGFTIEYDWRGNRGSLDVQSFPMPNGEYGLFVTLHEVRVKW